MNIDVMHSRLDSDDVDGKRAVGPWDWNGVIGTGQSLSVGAEATELELTTPSFDNLKLSLGPARLSGPPYDPNLDGVSVVPLVEPIRTLAVDYPGAYPFNVYGETPHTAMANQISASCLRDARGDHVTVHSVVGESGQGLVALDKLAIPTSDIGHAYAASMFEVAALTRLAEAAGKSYGVSAIIVTHGETDASNPEYASSLYRLYRDYNSDIAAITGQKSKVVLLLTQQQALPTEASPPLSTLAAWKLGLEHPGEFVCVGPKYQYRYAPDNVHLVARSYDQLGEKYGQVYYERVVCGRDWQPLQPIAVTRRGAHIAVRFHVPVLPLVWDEDLPAPHQAAHLAWAKGRGFEVEDEFGELTIDSVSIEGDTVVIALPSGAAVRSAGRLWVRYAVTPDGFADGRLHGGCAEGRIGQLRDSDPAIGHATRMPLHNFAVSFAWEVQ